MWIVRWIFIVIGVVFLIGFAMQNADISVPIKFYKWETINDLPLWLVMYVSFVAGMIFWLLVSIYQVITLKSAARKSDKRAEQYKAELERLRNVSVDDAVLPVKSSDSTLEKKE